MSKRIIILFISFILGVSCYSQVERLNKTFVFDGNNVFQTIIPTDTGYLIGGILRNTIALIDSSANVKWTKSYPFSLSSWVGSQSPVALKKTQDSNYISCGTVQNGTTTINKVFLNKYNDVFDTIYSKILLTDTVCHGCLHLCNGFTNNNGDYVLVGSDSKDSIGNYFDNDYSKGLLLLTNPNGDIQHYKTIGSLDNSDWFNTGLQMGNYYYLFGATRSYAPIQVTGIDRTDGWVVKTDLQGNEVLSAAFGSIDQYDNDFNSSLIIGNNKLLTTSNLGIYKHTSGVRISKPWLLLLNEDLSINKEIFFSQSEVVGDTLLGKYINTATIGKDSDIAVIGANYIYNLNTYTTLSGYGMLVVLNKDYKILFIRYYRHNGSVFNNFTLKTITPSSDGGYIFGGWVVDNSLTPTQQAWLVKTDSLGCDGYTSCNDTAMVVEILNYPDTLCQNDTNFIEVRLKGRSAPYSLYANDTLVLDSIYYPYSLPLWIDTTMMVFPTDTGLQQLIVTLHEPWERTAGDTIQVYVKNCISGFVSNEFYKQRVEIFPNPANTEIRVKLNEPYSGNYTVALYNMQGKQVKSVTAHSTETIIDISQLPEGVYEVKVTVNNTMLYQKVVKL